MSAVREGGWAEPPRRALAIGSVVIVALWLLAILIIEGIGNSPDSGNGQELVRYFGEDEMSIYAGSILFMLGSVLLIWWASMLRNVVDTHAGTGSWLGGVIQGSAVATAVLSIGFVAPQIGAAFAANDEDVTGLEPAAAQALWWAGDGFFIGTAYAGASLFVAVALAAWRFRLLPVWVVAIIGLGVLVMLIPGVNWLGVIFGIPIAVLLSGLLLRPSGRGAVREQAA